MKCQLLILFGVLINFIHSSNNKIDEETTTTAIEGKKNENCIFLLKKGNEKISTQAFSSANIVVPIILF